MTKLSKALETLTVVYVEDEEEIRAQVSLFLRRRIAALYEGANGQEGLELTMEKRPDLVITDLEMPVMDGLEMIRMIRQELGEKTPIIVLTGYHDEAHHTDLADVYIFKPIDLFELLERIKQFLG